MEFHSVGGVMNPGCPAGARASPNGATYYSTDRLRNCMKRNIQGEESDNAMRICRRVGGARTTERNYSNRSPELRITGPQIAWSSLIVEANSSVDPPRMSQPRSS